MAQASVGAGNHLVRVISPIVMDVAKSWSAGITPKCAIHSFIHPRAVQTLDELRALLRKLA